MTVEAQIVVVGKVQVFFALDAGHRASAAFVYLEERIADAEALRSRSEHAQLHQGGMIGKTGQGRIHRWACISMRALQGRAPAVVALFALQDAADEFEGRAHDLCCSPEVASFRMPAASLSLRSTACRRARSASRASSLMFSSTFPVRRTTMRLAICSTVGES